MNKTFNAKTYLVLLSCLLLQMVCAQSIGPSSVKTKEAGNFQWSIGPLAGFKTIKSLVVYDFGLQLSHSLDMGQRLRLEVSYRTAGSNLEQNWGRIPMNMKADIGSLIVGTGYDWFPFVKRGIHGNFLKSLKLTGGVWYVDKPEYNFDARLQDPLVWGDITFSPEEIGSVSTRIKTNKVQPFVGLGYDQFYLGQNINFSLNGGVLYQGKPEVTMVATNMLKPTEESADRFEQNLASYQFSPFVQLNIQYNYN